MSVGPLGGVYGSAAGAPLSQTKGNEAERSQRDAAVQQQVNDADKRAENAAGIGQTEQDEQTSDRDADGPQMFGRPDTRAQHQHRGTQHCGVHA